MLFESEKKYTKELTSEETAIAKKQEENIYNLCLTNDKIHQIIILRLNDTIIAEK